MSFYVRTNGSPCKKDCPNRMPCGECRKSCQPFLAYEKNRIENGKTAQKLLGRNSYTAGHIRFLHQSMREKKRGRYTG